MRKANCQDGIDGGYLLKQNISCQSQIKVEPGQDCLLDEDP
jgi:hypothetical protein